MPGLDPIELGGCLVATYVPSLRGERRARIHCLVVEPDLFKAQQLAERWLRPGEAIESVTRVPRSEIPPDVVPGAILIWS